MHCPTALARDVLPRAVLKRGCFGGCAVIYFLFELDLSPRLPQPGYNPTRPLVVYRFVRSFLPTVGNTTVLNHGAPVEVRDHVIPCLSVSRVQFSYCGVETPGRAGCRMDNFGSPVITRIDYYWSIGSCVRTYRRSEPRPLRIMADWSKWPGSRHSLSFSQSGAILLVCVETPSGADCRMYY